MLKISDKESPIRTRNVLPSRKSGITANILPLIYELSACEALYQKLFESLNIKYQHHYCCSKAHQFIKANLSSLPIFNPFDEITDKMSHELTECDEVFDNFVINSHILNQWQYYDIPQFANKINSIDNPNKFTLLGLNVDGFKTNFDKFKIFNYELSKAGINISCYSFCETNVLLQDSDFFYIDGFNKFIPDKNIMSDYVDTGKRKGFGLAIFLTKKIDNASIDYSFCLSTPDIKLLAVTFTSNDDITHYILGIYRSPSGNFDNFIEQLDLFLTK